MQFDAGLLDTYRQLVQTTSLADSYGEFVRLFRFLWVQMEKEMPQFQFQGNIVENAMDYSYFQFTSQELKSRGLKIAVVFLHRQFRLEVWLSGVNRSSQKRWFPVLAAEDCPFLRTENPERSDYILRSLLPDGWNLADGDGTVSMLKQKALELIAWSEGKWV